MDKVDRAKTLVRIVDDDAGVRAAISFMLSCSGWPVACYDRAAKFLSSDPVFQPGCVLLDIRMPEMSGIELQNELAERALELPIIFITGYADVATAVDALRKGAYDFLEKPVDGERLLASVEEACTISVAKSCGGYSTSEIRRLVDGMTPREKQVLALLHRELSNREIAEAMNVAERTVEGYRARIYRSLRVHSLRELKRALSVIPDDLPVFRR